MEQAKLLSDFNDEACLPCSVPNHEFSMQIMTPKNPSFTYRSLGDYELRILKSAVTIIGGIQKALIFLVPSFLQSYVNGHQSPSGNGKLHPTAFLDGLRGYAAYLVFLHHLSSTIHDINHGWGFSENYKSILRLPFLRLFYGSGNAMVAVFFVISGFSLSLKPIKAMQCQDWLELRRTISSSILRRPFRLYLPCLASTFLLFILLRLKVFEITRSFSQDSTYLNHARIENPELKESFWLQFIDWLWQFYNFMNVWTLGWDDHPLTRKRPYDGHLWSIDAEFRCSINLFITQVAVAGLKPHIRILVLALLITWAISAYFFGPTLFYAGFLIAELYHRRIDSVTSNILSTRQGPTRLQKGREGNIKTLFYIFCFALGLYLCSTPNKGLNTTPGWITLFQLAPRSYRGKENKYLGTIGAVLIVWSTFAARSLQCIFESALAQYLGEISFMLYILHYTVTHNVGFMLMKSIWNVTGIETETAKETGFVLSAILITVVLVWISDIFVRLVDRPVIRFTKWIEKQITV